MTGTCHVKFTNLLTHLIYNHVACNVLSWSYWWMAKAISSGVRWCRSTAVLGVCMCSGLVVIAPELS